MSLTYNSHTEPLQCTCCRMVIPPLEPHFGSSVSDVRYCHACIEAIMLQSGPEHATALANWQKVIANRKRVFEGSVADGGQPAATFLAQ